MDDSNAVIISLSECLFAVNRLWGGCRRVSLGLLGRRFAKRLLYGASRHADMPERTTPSHFNSKSVEFALEGSGRRRWWKGEGTMPNVHFIGEVSFVVSDLSAVSITWAIVPGNDAWVARSGLNFGESHIAESSPETGKAVICHPIDIHFQASTTEGWPVFLFEVSKASSQICIFSSFLASLLQFPGSAS